MFFSTIRNAVKGRKQAELDRDFWKARALALEAKLEQRSDFFIEREFRLIDRALTKNGTFAITDEIRAKAVIENDETEKYALEAYLEEQREFLVQCAKDAGKPDPEDVAAKTFEQNRAAYILDFQQQRIN